MACSSCITIFMCIYMSLSANAVPVMKPVPSSVSPQVSISCIFIYIICKTYPKQNSHCGCLYGNCMNKIYKCFYYIIVASFYLCTSNSLFLMIQSCMPSCSFIHPYWRVTSWTWLLILLLNYLTPSPSLCCHYDFMLKDLLKAIARLFQVEVNAIQTEDIVISSDSDATKELGFEVIGTQSESNPGYFVVYSGTSPGVTSSCVPLVRIIIIVYVFV